jgi:hypothetical protein
LYPACDQSLVARVAIAKRRLFAFDIRSLDDRPPFLDLGLLKRRQGFRCLLFPAGDYLARARYSRTRYRILQCFHDRRVEFANIQPAKHENITVACCPRSPTDADAAARTGYVLNYNRLTERHPQSFADILVSLVRRGGQLATKRELIAEV